MADPTLIISAESVCFVIVKAREIDAEDLMTEDDSEAEETDDDEIDEDIEAVEEADSEAAQELRGFISALGEDEQTDLVALLWLGRGDGTLEEWDDLREEADRQHNSRTAAYLMGEPLLSDHLEQGLSQFGLSCAEFDSDHL
ncbi:DUF3775 domain-containing protein [soil metagenome]